MNLAASESSTKLLLRASRTLFFVSLLLPAYVVDYYGKTQWHFGLEALLLGPIGLFAGHFSWLANPVLWFAWRKKSLLAPQAAKAWSFIAIALASSFLFTSRVAVGSAGDFPYQAHIGFYVWLGSMFLALASAATVPLSSSAAPEDSGAL